MIQIAHGLALVSSSIKEIIKPIALAKITQSINGYVIIRQTFPWIRHQIKRYFLGLYTHAHAASVQGLKGPSTIAWLHQRRNRVSNKKRLKDYRFHRKEPLNICVHLKSNLNLRSHTSWKATEKWTLAFAANEPSSIGNNCSMGLNHHTPSYMGSVGLLEWNFFLVPFYFISAWVFKNINNKEGVR